MISFVCSVGNIPLASLLWAHGISFGGVISFIYADLIVIPILMIYAKYYGVRAAAWITAIFYVSMVLAGIIVDLIFIALGLIPQGPRPPSAIEHAHITWNYTSWLDLIAPFSPPGSCFCISDHATGTILTPVTEREGHASARPGSVAKRTPS